MHSLPLFHRIAGERVVVVGDGEMAAAKRRLVERAGGICCGEDEAARLALVALEDWSRAEAAAARLKARGLLVNVADRPELCDFTLPSVLERGDVVVAVGTGGASAGLAKHLRLRLEALLPSSLGPLAEGLAAARQVLRDRWPQANERRRALDDALAEGGPLDPLDPSPASGRLEKWLAGDVTTVTDRMVEIILTSDEPEELTLRQARLLGTAETILHDPQVSPEILARARADAHRELLAAGAAQDREGLVLVLRRSGPPPDGVWFHYTRRAGRMTAKPVGATGWAVLIGSIVALVAASLAGAVAFGNIHPLLAIAAGPVILIVGLMAFFRMVIRRGHRVE